eukprot:m.263991 g.263991  ORF g.263991 m.263991 type:complete len:118 (-) comp11053_c2_seq9:907-1260(-)
MGWVRFGKLRVSVRDACFLVLASSQTTTLSAAGRGASSEERTRREQPSACQQRKPVPPSCTSLSEYTLSPSICPLQMLCSCGSSPSAGFDSARLWRKKKEGLVAAMKRQTARADCSP